MLEPLLERTHLIAESLVIALHQLRLKITEILAFSTEFFVYIGKGTFVSIGLFRCQVLDLENSAPRLRSSNICVLSIEINMQRI